MEDKMNNVQELQIVVESFQHVLGNVNHPEMRYEGWVGFADLQLFEYVSSQEMTPSEFSYAFQYTAKYFNRIGSAVRNPKAFFYVNFKTTCERRVERIKNTMTASEVHFQDQDHELDTPDHAVCEDAKAEIVVLSDRPKRVYPPPPPAALPPPTFFRPPPPSFSASSAAQITAKQEDSALYASYEAARWLLAGDLEAFAGACSECKGWELLASSNSLASFMARAPATELDDKTHSQAVRRGYQDARTYMLENGLVKFEIELRRRQGYLHFLNFIQTYTSTCFHN